jgi:hypothetical protein
MPQTYASLTLEDAKQMLSAAEAKAASLGIPYCVAVVDDGVHLMAFLRQDGALIGSVDLAIDKATTARIFEVINRYCQGTEPSRGPERLGRHHGLRGCSGNDTIGLQPAVDQRPLCRRGPRRRSNRYTAIPARIPRTNLSWFVLGQLHGPE